MKDGDKGQGRWGRNEIWKQMIMIKILKGIWVIIVNLGCNRRELNSIGMDNE